MAEVVEMLALSPTMDEGTIAEWTKSEGDEVDEGEVIAEVETDKATMEMESFFEGTLLEILVEAGGSVEVGQPIAIIGEAGEDISDLLDDLAAGAEEPSPTNDEQSEAAAPSSASDEDAVPAASSSSTAGGPVERTDGERIFASPLARRMASEKGLPLERIAGSGPKGRIIKRDIETALEEGLRTPRRREVPTGELEPVEVDLSQMRKTIARRLQESWHNAPHFMLTVSIDMAAAMARRSEINESLAELERDVKISVNDIIVKACALALQRYPDVNVSFKDDHIARYDTSNVGVAVAVDEGLVTPVIRAAEVKTLSEIAVETRRLAEKARNKDLAPEDYTGGTFTVSNLGMYGIEHFTAVINPPEAAILACGAVDEVPVVENGELTVGTRMKATLSCDHRAVDGATGAEFLGELVKLLENPMGLVV